MIHHLDKSSIDEPPEVELKDLPPHLEYEFLEGDDKLSVIIAKYLSVEEKTALVTVLKSHKLAIAWKLFDIKEGRYSEEYSLEVLGFSDVIASGNLTPCYDLIVSMTSLTLTPFGNSDFLLKEVDAFLALEDDPTSPEELKIYEAKTDNSSIDEPHEVELKDLPPHLEYVFLEGDDKFPVIIAIDLSIEEKIALIMVEEEIIRDLERLDIKLYVRGQHGYWASLRVETDLISRIKEAQKEDNEIWTIVENLDKQVEFRLDDDNVLWQGTRLVVPNDASLREALLTEAHSSPFSVHPGSTNMYHDLKQHFRWSGMKGDVEFHLDDDHVLWQDTRLVVPNDASLREALLTEARSSLFSVHPGSTKMYHDLKQHFWWSGMRRDVAMFVSKCLICQQVKIEHQRASGLLQQLDIPVWKWDEISMDFVTGLPRTQRRHDSIWVVVDRLTKSAHFLPIRKDYSVSRLADIFQQEIVRLHSTPSAIVSDRDPRFASRFWKGLQKAWGTRLKFSTAFHP
nr:retrotransposable element Tf2 [Tanacetum cinerariifolium]